MSQETTLRCQELVALATDYLEGALPAHQHRHMEAHVLVCAGCEAYLEQMRHVVALTGKLREGDDTLASRQRALSLFRERLQARRKDPRRNVELGIGDNWAAPGDHLAYFWEDDREFDAGMGFLEAGLEDRDYCFVFGFDQANQKVLERLRQRGTDVEGLLQAGRLTVVGGNASPEAMLSNIGKLFQAAVASGAPLIRLLGNLGWGRANWPGEEGILAFEAQVTEAARQFPCVILCMYDVASLSGRIILKGGFETHPATVRGKQLQENPHFVPTEQFLAQLEKRTRLGHLH